jgi:hypothetical protein
LINPFTREAREAETRDKLYPEAHKRGHEGDIRDVYDDGNFRHPGVNNHS